MGGAHNIAYGKRLNRGANRLNDDRSVSLDNSTCLTIAEPATHAVIERVPITQHCDVVRAVKRATSVQPAWAACSLKDRANWLLQWRRKLVNNGEQLTQLLSRENGKPLHEAWLHELMPLCDAISWLANEAPKLLGERTIPLRWMKQHKSLLVSKPKGQCAIISPYNFPLMIPFSDAAAALVAGCSVLIKPSEHTPLTALAVAKLALESGLEPGLLQILPGGPDVARSLIDSGVDEVLFTGSLGHGREIACRCADKLIPCTLELGGKAPLLVLEDANVDNAAAAIVLGALANSGQSCIAVERVLVHTKIHQRLVDAVVDRVKRLRQGNSMLAEVDLGALTSLHHLEHVQRQVDAALAMGATLLHGGHRNSEPGNFFQPTVLDGCTPEMSITIEETFGPVIPIVPIESVPMGLEIANCGATGLAAYVFGDNEEKLDWIARRLRAGHVLLNDVLWSYICPEIPFGGLNQSGWGVVHGAEGLRTHTHSVHLGSSRFKVPEVFGLGFPYSKGPRTLLKQALRLITR